ncbi:MAG TPA: cytoplasmic protein [Scandinavium sp.]|jgi:ribosomal protein S27AE|uniref:IS1/IS1595 family N-terminal zinc-binding domain-containing protein n=1 Tax=Scandinavium sp. TaxID=2830653 RepID=UPI002E32FCF2|nr:cytoplasmic protein [Scandinavium sp.]HEX4500312.1 cytoplasmic protein [Scandinavium sp.]
MFKQRNVNCCKTYGCKNLGVLNSPSYQQQGQRVLCLECGFYFPVIGEHALNSFKKQVNKGYQGLISLCPACGDGKALVRHGYTRNGVQRVRCGDCQVTFSQYYSEPASSRLITLGEHIQRGESLTANCGERNYNNTRLGRDLSKMAFHCRLVQSQFIPLSHEVELSTAVFFLNFNASSNRLYVIVSADKKSNRVIAVSTNYAPHANEIPEVFHYNMGEEEVCSGKNMILRVFAKDRLMSRRKLYFDAQYGAAQVKKNDGGIMVKPVLAAYRHFELVKDLTGRDVLSVRHYLEHECFIYGGCLMANVDGVLNGNCHISFVYEQGVSNTIKSGRTEMFTSDIIWNDAWYYYSQPNYNLAVCSLTGSQGRRRALDATLEPAQSFIRFVQHHPYYPRLTHHSPARINDLLEFLLLEYNLRFTNMDVPFRTGCLPLPTPFACH